MCRQTEDMGLLFVEALNKLTQGRNVAVVFPNLGGLKVGGKPLISLLVRSASALGKIADKFERRAESCEKRMEVNDLIMETIQGRFTPQQRVASCEQGANHQQALLRKTLSKNLQKIATHESAIKGFKYLTGLPTDRTRLQRASMELFQSLNPPPLVPVESKERL